MPALPLSNPISSELSEMRVSLWPGLLQALRRNLSRRQGRVRVFEQGLKFILEDTELKQVTVTGGLLAGSRLPEQWGAAAEDFDFHDAKGDVEGLLALTTAGFRFEAADHPALHPGQSARILREGREAGWLGALHPRLVRALDLDRAPLLWELEADVTFAAELPGFTEISRFPAIRRDIAVVVDQQISVQALTEAIRSAGGALLTESKVFDVYSGDRIDSGRKSVAFGLILQESSRTLTDEDADRVVAAVVARLESEFGARMRN
jgi:phenylalanyl-tRNA synthetase beta chain